MVERRGIHTDSFKGFSILVLGYRTMQCTRNVPGITVVMGNYSMTYHFFMVDVSNTNVVLSV